METAAQGEAPSSPGDQIVEVAVAVPVDGTFSYRNPLPTPLRLGHTVKVPFGPRNVTGYVLGPAAAPGPGGFSLKAVAELLDPEPAFDETQLALCRFAADYYLASLGEMIATSLPAAFKQSSRRVWKPTELGMRALGLAQDMDTAQRRVLREVVARPGRSLSALQRALDAELEEGLVRRQLEALRKAELVADEQIDPEGPKQLIQTIERCGEPGQVLLRGGARMRGVLQAIEEAGGTIDLRVLVETQGDGSREAVTRLERLGLVRRGQREDRRGVGDDGAFTFDSTIPQLNEEQQHALSMIRQAGSRALLLHGVTGAGKTEVYLRAAAEVLESGRQVLLLVPEISLTPQLLGRFRSRFGEKVAVLHSALSPGERLREWRRIRAEEATIAVGARSALFAPFRRLGLILIDEEHDDSYKQDDGVRYHARDLAVVRGRLSDCTVVLGSATPSLETWTNAREGRYLLATLKNRATIRPVPRVDLIDMCGLPPDQPISPQLQDALAETFQRGGKAIVLFNRRGFAPSVECPGCGATHDCPSCGIPLVLHRQARRLTCHYCGFFAPWPEGGSCGLCGTTLATLGFGTERVEEVMQSLFPDIRILRMDADTTRQRGSHARILGDFKGGGAELLIGTQLVAKGHDFPDVHLAAVVGVDNILGLPDFRSAERAWSLVTQLAGRAGRGDTAGRVLVQTRHKEHFVFRQLLAGELDLGQFHEAELRQRRALGYPPTTRLVLLRVEGEEKEAVEAYSQELARQLRSRALLADPQVLGPVAAPMSRLVGRWRYQLVLRGRGKVTAFRNYLKDVRSLLFKRPPNGIRLITDVDPRNLL